MDDNAMKHQITITLETDLYPLESIQLAACGFLDQGFFHLSRENPGSGRITGVNVGITARQGVNSQILAGKFCNELNRQSLRLFLDKANRKVRTQIVGRALSSSLPPQEKHQKPQ